MVRLWTSHMEGIMEEKNEKHQKLYYSIGEVAEMFDLKDSTLRFWEKEFNIINPRKNEKGTRFYKEEDIDAVRVVYYLLKEQKLTLAGAKKRLKENKEGVIKQAELMNRLQQIKKELLDLKQAFDQLESR